jgi:hypothetical protein
VIFFVDKLVILGYNLSMTNKTLPVIGTPGFYSVGSDIYPCTVVRVTKTRIYVRDAKRWVVEGSVQDGTAVYAFEADSNGRELTFTLRDCGAYRERGCNHGRLHLGEYRAYMDPSF